MTGQMLAFDKVREHGRSLQICVETDSLQHMNLVLADTEEFRRTRKKPQKPPPGTTAAPLVESEEKRTLGLTIVRGTHIISLSVESGPPPDPSARLGASAPGGPGTAPPTMAAGPGITRAAGRGMPVGLTGPAAGVGGPGFGGMPGFGRAAPGGGPRESSLGRLLRQILTDLPPLSWFSPTRLSWTAWRWTS